jgi:hypothetical protein
LNNTIEKLNLREFKHKTLLIESTEKSTMIGRTKKVVVVAATTTGRGKR